MLSRGSRLPSPGGRDTRVVLLNYRRDGSPFFNELRLSAIRDEDGVIEQFIGVQNDVSALIHTQRSLERQHTRTAADLRAFQDALTPPALPTCPGLEMATAGAPAEFGVGGDFALVANGPGSSTVMAVGDAIGHGISAARRATFVRTAMASFAPFCDDPRELLEMTNHAIVKNAGTSSEFITATCVIYEPRKRQLRWACAGHPIPMWLDSGTPIGPIAYVSTALGILPRLGGSSGCLQLPANTGILLYTDGLTEARSADHSRGPALQFGELRVQQVLQHHAGQAPKQLVDHVVAEVRAHTRGAAADDLCLLAARTT